MARINQGILVKAYTKKDGQQVDEHYRRIKKAQDLIGTEQTIEAGDYGQFTGKVLDAKPSDTILNKSLTYTDKDGKEYSIFATIKDKNGREYAGWITKKKS